MRYMMFIKHSEDLRKLEIPKGLNDAMGEFVGAEMKKGTIVDTAGLTPTSAATRIRLKSGKLTVTDGPFTETKEIIGGYAIVDVQSPAEALDLAMRFMELHRLHWPEFEGESEMRPIEVG